MTAPEIEVRIDELVVEGTPAPHGGAQCDRAAVGEAVRAALPRLLEERERQAVGAAVAEAVHRGLGG